MKEDEYNEEPESKQYAWMQNKSATKPLKKSPPSSKGNGQDISFLQDEVSFAGLWKLLLSGNPFYLISAGLILYASTVVSNTANIWLETGIPVGILAAYTLLCALTVIFIVQYGKVWSDARSLLFVILVLPLGLSAGLDDKLLSTPETGPFWLAGSLLFTAGVFYWVKRGLRLRLNAELWIVFATLLAIFFLWPLFLSRLVIDFPDDRRPLMWGIALFPTVFAVAALPLLFLVRRQRFLLKENGTPWEPLTAFLFGLLGLGGILRSYLMSISFYPAKGVGGFTKMESGFSGWMLLPLLLIAALIIAEWMITARKGNKTIGNLVFFAGCAFFLAVAFGRSGLARQFYSEVWGTVPLIVLPFAALLILLGYMAIRRVKLALVLLGALVLCVGLGYLCRYVIMQQPSMKTVAICAGSAVTLILGGIAIWRRNRWVTLLLLFWLIGCGNFLLEKLGCLPDLQSGNLPDFLPDGFAHYLPMFIVWSIVTLILGRCLRDRKMEMIGLAWSAALFVPNFILMLARPDCIYPILLWFSYGLALFFLSRRYWIPAAVETFLLSAWGLVELTKFIQRQEIRGIGIIFWGLIFFICAFAISLWKGGILQRRTPEWVSSLIRFFKEKP